MTYSEKLLDPRWQKKRLGILDRDDFTCQACMDNTKTLNVHHRFYEKDTDPWDYEDSTLITLCSSCHEAEEELKNKQWGALEKDIRRRGFDEYSIQDIRIAFTCNQFKYPPEVVAAIIKKAFTSEEWCARMADHYFGLLRHAELQQLVQSKA